MDQQQAGQHSFCDLTKRPWGVVGVGTSAAASAGPHSLQRDRQDSFCDLTNSKCWPSWAAQLAADHTVRLDLRLCHSHYGIQELCLFDRLEEAALAMAGQLPAAQMLASCWGRGGLVQCKPSMAKCDQLHLGLLYTLEKHWSMPERSAHITAAPNICLDGYISNYVFLLPF